MTEFSYQVFKDINFLFDFASGNGLSSQDNNDRNDTAIATSELYTIHNSSCFIYNIAVEVQSKCKQVTTIYKCPSEWAQFIKSLASTSPTCALLHPSETVAS